MSLTIIDSNHIFQKDVIGNVRTAQEDSHDIATLTPNGDVFVVCDGMGGHVGGKQASSIAVKSIIEYLKREKYAQPLQALNEALQFANMQILGYSNEHPELKGMGTTACIVLLQETEAYIAHVGDSRIYLYLEKEKQLHRITKDHSFVQTLVDAGQISDEEAEHHPNKNRILKALGIKSDLTPSLNQLRPKNGDMFLICSDGLNGMIPDSTIKEVLLQNNPIPEMGEKLINLALEAGGTDNITLELIKIANSPHKKSIFTSYNPRSAKRSSINKNIEIVENNSIEQYTKSKENKRAKKPLSKIVLAIVVIIAIGAILFFLLYLNNKKTQLENLKADIAFVDNSINKLEKEFDEQNEKLNNINKEHQTNIKEIKDPKYKSEIEKNYNEQCAILKSEIEKIQKDIDSITARKDSLYIKWEKDSTNFNNLKKLNIKK